MNILITGGSGFLGSNLAGSLKFTNWDIKEGKNIFDDGLEDAIAKADIVIHLAAFTSVSKSIKDPAETFVTNIVGTHRVVSLCIKYKKKLIYPSSAMVFYPYSSPYAMSKKVAEVIVEDAKDKTDIVILRFCNIFGPYMNFNSGSLMYNFLINNKIVIYGDGKQTRDFIHVRDVISIIQEAFDNKWNGRTVDVGTGHNWSINHIAQLFSKYRSIPIVHEPSREEVRNITVDTEELMQVYKGEITTNLDEDIRQLCTM